jgi:hypothetical protein
MSSYSLLVTLHIVSVIIWLGAVTTLALITIYARRAPTDVLLGQLGSVVLWMSLWVLAPVSLAAFGLGFEAAEVGHWPELLFFHIGEGAFVFSFVLTVAVRLPLLRRARRGGVDDARLPGYLLALATAELTVLYLAVAAMVVKPTETGSSVVRSGGIVLALGLLSAAVIAYRTRRSTPSGGANGQRLRGHEPLVFRPIKKVEEEVHELHAVVDEGEAATTPYLATLGIFLVVILPAFLVMVGLAAGAYYLF